MYKPKDFADLKQQTIRAILERNIMQGRLEHGSVRYWLCEFISLPYGSPLDKPYLCSYLRKLTEYMTISCYPIEPSMSLLSNRLDVVASALYAKHKECLVTNEIK